MLILLIIVAVVLLVALLVGGIGFGGPAGPVVHRRTIIRRPAARTVTRTTERPVTRRYVDDH